MLKYFGILNKDPPLSSVATTGREIWLDYAIPLLINGQDCAFEPFKPRWPRMGITGCGDDGVGLQCAVLIQLGVMAAHAQGSLAFQCFHSFDGAM